MGGDLTSHTPAHNLLLPLLPSGPGGVHRSLLRGDRLDHHCSLQPGQLAARPAQEARIIITLPAQCNRNPRNITRDFFRASLVFSFCGAIN